MVAFCCWVSVGDGSDKLTNIHAIHEAGLRSDPAIVFFSARLAFRRCLVINDLGKQIKCALVEAPHRDVRPDAATVPTIFRYLFAFSYDLFRISGAFFNQLVLDNSQ